MSLDWQGALNVVLEHPLFSVGLTLAVYQLAQALYARTKLMLLQPLLVAVLLLVGTLVLLRMDYQLYKN
ncbi:MAG: LrgB family protein, partial [Gammaproteobacteria bacterium]|nr:LrgB family protein [Gammaproteobacteria bacterium]